jgi:hypothetical protein
VSLPLVVGNLGLLALLLTAKLGSKTAAVYPLARRQAPEDTWAVSLLMSTGLTFGTIASQVCLSHGYISQEQFSVLVSIVLLSAVIPTAIAQRLLTRGARVDEEALMAEAASGYGAPPGDDDEVPVHRPRHPHHRLPAGEPEGGEHPAEAADQHRDQALDPERDP